MSARTTTPTPATSRWRTSRVVSLIGLLAWVSAAVAVWNLIAWGNRWYVATQLLPPAAGGAPEGWELAYERMTVVHQTLVDGFAALRVAEALGLLWRRWSRR